MKTRSLSTVTAAALLALGSVCVAAHAQTPQVLPITATASPPELIVEGTQAATTASHAGGGLPSGSPVATPPKNAAPMVGPVDLGETLGQSGSGTDSEAQTQGRMGTAQRAALAARQESSNATPRTSSSAKAKSAGMGRAADRPGVERAVFDRHPVRVALPVERERLITLPAPAALHVPHDLDAVARIEAIDRTIYVTALVPFAPIRIVAELIDGGQQIPIDLVAGPQASQASGELQIFLASRAGEGTGGASAGSGDTGAGDTAPPAADMVQLTRFASRMLYAPTRLATPEPGIQQVQVAQQPLSGLLRGARVLAVPMGQWRSAGLYVTAVRVTNQSAIPLELQLEQLRGRWLAATAQHGRLGASGSQTDTTALYLVCDRAFESCL